MPPTHPHRRPPSQGRARAIRYALPHGASAVPPTSLAAPQRSHSPSPSPAAVYWTSPASTAATGDRSTTQPMRWVCRPTFPPLSAPPHTPLPLKATLTASPACRLSCRARLPPAPPRWLLSPPWRRQVTRSTGSMLATSHPHHRCTTLPPTVPTPRMATPRTATRCMATSSRSRHRHPRRRSLHHSTRILHRGIGSILRAAVTDLQQPRPLRATRRRPFTHASLALEPRNHPSRTRRWRHSYRLQAPRQALQGRVSIPAGASTAG